MEIRIRLTQIDLIEHQRTVLADGPARLKDNKISYREKDNPDVLNKVSFADGHVVIERFAEISSKTELFLDKKGTAVVHSSYGDMMLDTLMTHYFHKEDLLIVEYQIVSGSEVVTKQRLIWEMKGVSDERN